MTFTKELSDYSKEMQRFHQKRSIAFQVIDPKLPAIPKKLRLKCLLEMNPNFDERDALWIIDLQDKSTWYHIDVTAGFKAKQIQFVSKHQKKTKDN